MLYLGKDRALFLPPYFSKKKRVKTEQRLKAWTVRESNLRDTGRRRGELAVEEDEERWQACSCAGSEGTVLQRCWGDRQTHFPARKAWLFPILSALFQKSLQWQSNVRRQPLVLCVSLWTEDSKQESLLSQNWWWEDRSSVGSLRGAPWPEDPRLTCLGQRLAGSLKVPGGEIENTWKASHSISNKNISCPQASRYSGTSLYSSLLQVTSWKSFWRA